jgi:hypothetical protein
VHTPSLLSELLRVREISSLVVIIFIFFDPESVVKLNFSYNIYCNKAKIKMAKYPTRRSFRRNADWVPAEDFVGKVLDIIYWRDPKKSGIVLGAIFVLLFLVAKFSFILIGTYSALLILICTLGFRIFKLAEAKFKKTEDKNPFQPMLEKELDVPQEKIHAQVDVLVENVRNIALQLRRLFFVESFVDSVKFFFLLYSLTYIGSWFSGFALIILFVIGVFTVPKVYEMNKEPIDNYLNLAKENVDKLHQTVGEKVTFLNTSATVPPVTKKDE